MPNSATVFFISCGFSVEASLKFRTGSALDPPQTASKVFLGQCLNGEENAIPLVLGVTQGRRYFEDFAQKISKMRSDLISADRQKLIGCIQKA